MGISDDVRRLERNQKKLVDCVKVLIKRIKRLEQQLESLQDDDPNVIVNVTGENQNNRIEGTGMGNTFNATNQNNQVGDNNTQNISIGITEEQKQQSEELFKPVIEKAKEIDLSWPDEAPAKVMGAHPSPVAMLTAAKQRHEEVLANGPPPEDEALMEETSWFEKTKWVALKLAEGGVEIGTAVAGSMAKTPAVAGVVAGLKFGKKMFDERKKK